MSSRTRRRSKLDPFVDQLGVLSDTEIAAQAGVTPENVRAFRKRRGIPARWRGEGVRQARTRTTPKATRESDGAKRRKTKLDPYLDRLGVLPDTEIAELAGVTVGNVRAYRYRHGIPSAREGAKGEKPAAAPAPIVKPARPAAPKVIPTAAKEPEQNPPAHAKPQVAASEASPSPGMKAFRIKVEGIGGTVAYVVLAENIAEAAGKALRTLEQRRVEGEVLSVEFLAVALQP